MASSSASQNTQDSKKASNSSEDSTLIDSAQDEFASEEEKPDIRVFKCVIRSLRITNGQKFNNPVVKFELGGDYKIEDNRHRYIFLFFSITLAAVSVLSQVEEGNVSPLKF